MIEMSVVFPNGPGGSREPLVVTGRQGSGDLVYVVYTDPAHVAFGFDHWGGGGVVGQPVAVDYGRAHRVSVTLQSLYPAESPAHASTRVRVALDGVAALEGNSPCYPAGAEHIFVGRNPIGGSTCGQAFNGRIVTVERPPIPPP